MSFADSVYMDVLVKNVGLFKNILPFVLYEVFPLIFDNPVDPAMLTQILIIFVINVFVSGLLKIVFQ